MVYFLCTESTAHPTEVVLRLEAWSVVTTLVALQWLVGSFVSIMQRLLIPGCVFPSTHTGIDDAGALCALHQWLRPEFLVVRWTYTTHTLTLRHTKSHFFAISTRSLRQIFQNLQKSPKFHFFAKIRIFVTKSLWCSNCAATFTVFVSVCGLYDSVSDSKTCSNSSRFALE